MLQLDLLEVLDPLVTVGGVADARHRVVVQTVQQAGLQTGLARGISGEGIGPAVESAGIAAELLAANDDDPAAEYVRRLATRFGDGRGGRFAGITSRMPGWVSEGLARAVCRAPLLRRKLIFESAFGMG